MESSFSVMDFPISELDQGICGSSISNIFEIQYVVDDSVRIASLGCSVDFLGLLLWSSGSTTTT